MVHVVVQSYFLSTGTRTVYEYIVSRPEIHYNPQGFSRDIDILFVKDHEINETSLWSDNVTTLEQLDM